MSYSSLSGDSKPRLKTVPVAANPISIVTQSELDDSDSDVNDSRLSGKKVGSLYLASSDDSVPIKIAYSKGTDAEDGWEVCATESKVNAVVRDFLYQNKDFSSWLKSMHTDKSLFVRNKGDGCYYISQQVDSLHAWEIKVLQDPDGFWRIDGMFMLTSESEVDEWAASLVKKEGTFTQPSSTYFYTVTAGDTISMSFTGTDLYLKSYRATNGGLWSFSVDGGPAVEVSCYYTAGSVFYPKIATGLSSGEHTVVGTFLGDDPAHTPSGGVGTGRGYFYWKEFINDTFHATATTDPVDTTAVPVSSDDLTSKTIGYVGSKIEFAFSVRPSVETGWSNQWVPDHTGSNNGAMGDMTSIVYINGKVVSLSDISEGMFLSIDSCLISTEYTAYHINDDSKTYPLWDGELFCKIGKDTIFGNHKMTFTTETYVYSGYAAMAAPPPSFGTFVTNSNETYEDVDDTVNIQICTQVLGTDGEDCVAVNWTYPDLFRFYRLAEGAYEDKLQILSSAYYNKVYPKIVKNAIISVGEIIEYSWEWNLGRYPDNFTN